MEYEYLSVEDRVYRVPMQGDPRKMERRTADGRWEPYRGDFAKVLVESAVSRQEPA